MRFTTAAASNHPSLIADEPGSQRFPTTKFISFGERT
ncbi:MAG: hypothetical protein QOF67_2906 [Mycobacterium sp.]|jgi:hypothetical protein|nr:hypothetical protein [Mycobacterium sp.]